MDKSKRMAAMNASDQSTQPAYEPIRAAAKRLNRNVGHLRKLCCQKWAKQGLARLEKHGAKGTWFIRTDATCPPRRKPARAKPRELSDELLRIALKKFPPSPAASDPSASTAANLLKAFEESLGVSQDPSRKAQVDGLCRQFHPTIAITVQAGATLVINPTAKIGGSK